MLTTDIKIRPSRLLTLLWLAMMCASVLCVAFLMISAALKMLLLVISFSYGLSILWQHCLLKSKYSITRLRLTADGWLIVTARQVWQGFVCGDSTLTYPFMVLRFKVRGRKRKLSCVICCDSQDQATYRQLLVLLRTTHAMQAEKIRRNQSVCSIDG
jgi:hypothetical protein